MATYYKTIDNVSAHSGVSRERIQAALDDLMSNKYLAEEEKQYRGKKPKVLVVNWDRLEEEGLWSNSQRMQKKALKIAISVNDMVEELQDSRDLQFKRKHNHHIGRNMGLPVWCFLVAKIVCV